MFWFWKTSRRTTRRPQTLAQTIHAQQNPAGPPSSPFTHAPLTHNHHNHTHAGAPYSGYPYYSQYPGYYPPYNAHEQKAASAREKGKEREASVGAGAGAQGTDDEAWEAAQHILRAINFGLQDPALGQGASEGGAKEVRTALTEEERVEVQRGLERLAGQLREIAEFEGEDEEEGGESALLGEADAEPAPAPPTPAPAPAPTSKRRRSARVSAAAAGQKTTSGQVDVGEDGTGGDGEADEDEDVEMVEVDVQGSSARMEDDALRT